MDIPAPDTEIITACDQLLVSLQQAEQNALTLLELLQELAETFATFRRPATVFWSNPSVR